MIRDNHDDPILFRFFNEIGIIDQLAQARLESVLPDGLKMSHFILINHLARLGGKWGPARLAAALQVTRAAITNTMNRLEQQGLVEIEAHPADGRGKLVSLTRRGRDLRKQSIRNIEPFLADLEQRLGSRFFSDVLPSLEALRRDLDENR